MDPICPRCKKYVGMTEIVESDGCWHYQCYLDRNNETAAKRAAIERGEDVKGGA